MRYIWKKNDVLGVTYKARSKNRILFLLEPKVFSVNYTMKLLYTHTHTYAHACIHTGKHLFMGVHV